eukprot:2895064-Amphidinium_carterae.1
MPDGLADGSASQDPRARLPHTFAMDPNTHKGEWSKNNLPSTSSSKKSPLKNHIAGASQDAVYLELSLSRVAPQLQLHGPTLGRAINNKIERYGLNWLLHKQGLGVIGPSCKKSDPNSICRGT